jgi:hypothetical protein
MRVKLLMPKRRLIRFSASLRIARALAGAAQHFATITGTTCGGGKSRNDALNTFDRERPGHRIATGESQRARRNDIRPTAFTFGHRSAARFIRGKVGADNEAT